MRSPSFASSPSRFESYAVPSSDDFPSLGELIRKDRKPALRTGSATAPIPTDALSTFTSAAALLRNAEHDTLERPPDSTYAAHPTEKPTKKKRAVAKPRVPKTVIAISPDASTVSDEVEEPPKQTKKTAAPRKRAPKVPKELSTDTSISEPLPPVPSEAKPAPAKRKRAPKTVKQAVPDIAASTPLTATAAEVETDAKLKKTIAGKDRVLDGRVTKTTHPGDGPPAKRSRKKAEVVSKHFATAPPVDRDGSQDLPTGLEPALRRRVDWTPPPVDTVHEITTGLSHVQGLSSAVKPFPLHDAAQLSESFLYKPPRQEKDKATGVADPVFTKRKAIEMVTAHASKSDKSPSPVKQKAPKKKARTITELATAAYAAPASAGASAGNLAADSLLNYLESNPVEGDKAAVCQPGHPASKPRSRAKGGPRQKKGRHLLLSPESAMRQSTRQDFVFGTSSQLATEASPTMLRDLQAAIKASAETEQSRLAADNSDPFASSPATNTRAAKRMSHGKLWAAGARGEDNDVMTFEVINLVDSPAIAHNPAADFHSESPLLTRNSALTKDSVIELLSSPLPTASVPSSGAEVIVPRSHFFPTQNIAALNSSSLSVPGASTSAADDSFEEVPPPSNQQAFQATQSPVKEPPVDVMAPRPKYELFTDAQLATQVAKYGFKPVKKRTGMIALLDQCWQSKNNATLGSTLQTSALSTTAPLPAGVRKGSKASSKATSGSPSRPRGRPRKDSTTSITSPEPEPVAASPSKSPAKRPRGRPSKDASVVPKAKTTRAKSPAAASSSKVATTPKRKKTGKTQEVADSDSSESFTSPEPLFTPPKPGDMSISEDTELSLALSPTDQQAVLFKHITQAITTAPRTTDPANPSWHEKMLMYDPIVLEDLTAWLNSGQLDRVGYDEEVGTMDVKKWCEARSVCCLWRVNIHGKERKRF